jgi:hypothetical protein
MIKGRHVHDRKLMTRMVSNNPLTGIPLFPNSILFINNFPRTIQCSLTIGIFKNEIVQGKGNVHLIL